MLVQTQTVAGFGQPNVGVLSIRHDLEKILPLDLVREHCRLDDTEVLGDGILRLYRDAAVEAAEEYTGLLIAEKKWISELVEHPSFDASRREPWFYHTAKHPFAHNIGYYYGVLNGGTNIIPLEIGSTRAKLPITMARLDMNCCRPCKDAPSETFMYMAGYDCEAKVPARFALGALKYIAHVVENAGDKTGILRRDVDTWGSNPAQASGAIEIWRTIRPDAI